MVAKSHNKLIYMNFFLLQAAASKGGSWQMIAMLVLMILIFWLFFIRPQTKKQKELQKQREALTNGDKIITAGGIHGVIKEVKDTYFIVEIDDNVRIRIDKTSVFVAGTSVAENGK
jgi:preprotein translocase subunit YajC